MKANAIIVLRKFQENMFNILLTSTVIVFITFFFAVALTSQ
ncbi:MAG: hypothetical protein WCK78_05665 [Paludibacter sp.]